MEQMLCGQVQAGRNMGSVLGFPTANIVVTPEQEANLHRGVFAARVNWQDRSAQGVVNIGVRPTFGGDDLGIELHVLDFEGNLYGTQLRVKLVAKIRNERRFEAVESLIEQIKLDVQRARELLNTDLKIS